MPTTYDISETDEQHGIGTGNGEPAVDDDEAKAHMCASEYAGLSSKSLNGKIARTLVKAARRAHVERVQSQFAKQLVPFFMESQKYIASKIKDPTKAFDPDQPRNPDGTWGSGGGSSGLNLPPEYEEFREELESYEPPRQKPPTDDAYVSAKEQFSEQIAEAKEWFAGSKVIDSNGDPLIVFHGTRETGFDSLTKDAWFTSDYEYAKQNAGANGRVFAALLKVIHPMPPGWDFTTEEALKIGFDGVSPEKGVWTVTSNNQIKVLSSEFEKKAFGVHVRLKANSSTDLSYINLKPLDKRLARTVAQPLLEAFGEGAAAEMRLRKAVERVKGYNPDQPRDSLGRFGSGGSAPGLPAGIAERIASSPDPRNLLIKPEWEAALREAGHTQEAIDAAGEMLDEHGGNESAVADAAIHREISGETVVGKALLASAALEEAAYETWVGGAKDRAQAELDEALRTFRPDDAYESFDDYASRQMRQQVALASGEKMADLQLYRGGDTNKPVQAWTTHEEGADTGGAGRIKPDKQMSLNKALGSGARILGGINRMVGAPGEGEVLLYVASAAEKAVANLRLKSSSASDFADDADDEIDFPTEFPEWLIAAAEGFLDDTFSEPYWTDINITTRDHIEVILREGVRDGLSMREIRDRIMEDAPEYSRSRAMNVARTETGGALNAGQVAAMEESGVDGKEWVSVLGSTTRDSHAEADGQQRGLDENFEVGGEECRWPGDISLPPGERCNCQCTVVSSFVGQALDEEGDGDVNLGDEETQ